jgi:dipeptidyl aminopeptidase/acylaminoacyl peptidase
LRVHLGSLSLEPELYDLGNWLAGTADGALALVGASRHEPHAVLAVHAPLTDRPTTTRPRSTDEQTLDLSMISTPDLFAVPTAHGMVHGFFHPPRHPGVTASASERPPLIVTCHGGPTSHVNTAYLPIIQYWTTRGYAHLTVNYAGSSGHGRAYRERLVGNWGVQDVADIVAVCRHLAADERIDPGRIAIRGSSAGGYTVLQALSTTDVFAAGTAYYPVADLEVFAKETHKLEAHYLERLVGAAHNRDTYRARSPIHHAHRIRASLVIFQGAEDRIVPLRQAEAIGRALTAAGVDHEIRIFGDEAHGFRAARSLADALRMETALYRRVLKRS